MKKYVILYFETTIMKAVYDTIFLNQMPNPLLILMKKLMKKTLDPPIEPKPKMNL